MQRERRRFSRAGIVALSVTVLLAAAGTAGYALAGRRAPASAHVPEPAAGALPVALTATSSTARVTYGGTVRLVGTIRDAGGAALPGRAVEVLTAPVTDPDTISVIATPVSDVAGRVRASFRPKTRTEVWLRFPGAPGLAEGTSAAVRVAVSPRVTMREITARTKSGWTTKLRGEVAPAPPGARVRLDRRTGSAWRALAVTRLDGQGGYSFTVRNVMPGRYTYRVVRPGTDALAEAESVRTLRLAAPAAPRVGAGAGTGGRGSLLVAGDSFAYYLGQQLTAERTPRVTTIESRHSSGLSRPDFYDWAAAARRQAATRPGGVVVFLGANDCQPIRLAGSGRWVSTGTDAWVGEYGRRAAGLMRTYSGGGARPVVWVGLPIVQKPDIAGCYRAINAATAAAARGVPGVRWIDSWTVYAVNGRYSAYVSGVLARQEDGIHLTYEGTRFLTRKVYAALG